MVRQWVTDDDWLVLQPLFDGRAGSPPKISNRTFLEAVVWKVRTGVPWRDLPEEFGPWKTIYSRFRRWATVGRFQAVFEALRVNVDNHWHSIDGSYVRAHQHSAGGKGGPADNAIGISRGGRTTKLHARVDAAGQPVQVEISAGNLHDSSLAAVLLAQITADAIIADKAYDVDAIVEMVEAAGAAAVIPPKKNRKNKRVYSKSLYKERNLVERFFCRLKHWRGIATRYEKTLTSFQGMVHLVCAILLLQ
jgi:transposase